VVFAVSPNERLIATSTKNGLLRTFALPSDINTESGDSFKGMECLKLFKLANQLVCEMTFDPSSKYLAVGTTDSQIKVFDVKNGFQTHNFLGHRGLIVKL